MDGKTNCLEILRKFLKDFLRKWLKIQYFSIFFIKINRPCDIFLSRLDDKLKLFGNFEKYLKFFDENSIEKLNFYLYLEKLLLTIEPSEITPFFQHFSVSVGGLHLLPLASPLTWLGFRELHYVVDFISLPPPRNALCVN